MAAKRILIIEDDLELCEELMDSLESEGYLAECVQDPIKGEELARDDSYDIVLLDYKMPLLSGLDILKKLKADNIKKRIFIITGRPSIEQVFKEGNLSDMVSGIITKPINFEVLLEKIKE
ncbi:MAG: response regulator transcription factor [Deltaproteobacteria bacterium]